MTAMLEDKRTGLQVAFVDAVVESGRDSSVHQALQENLQVWYSSGATPLWLNTFRNRGDCRLVCLVENFTSFESLMLDEIRSVAGVRETRTAFSFSGSANLDLLLDLEMEVLPHTEACSAFLEVTVAPGQDRFVQEHCAMLPVDDPVRVVWSLNSYNGQADDLSLLLLGSPGADLAEFTMRHIRSMEGVVATEMDQIWDWTWMAQPDSVIALCEHFAAEHILEDGFDDLDQFYADADW